MQDLLSAALFIRNAARMEFSAILFGRTVEATGDIPSPDMDDTALLRAVRRRWRYALCLSAAVRLRVHRLLHRVRRWRFGTALEVMNAAGILLWRWRCALALGKDDTWRCVLCAWTTTAPLDFVLSDR